MVSFRVHDQVGLSSLAVGENKNKKIEHCVVSLEWVISGRYMYTPLVSEVTTSYQEIISLSEKNASIPLRGCGWRDGKSRGACFKSETGRGGGGGGTRVKTNEKENQPPPS